jgi:hypothetical protein
VKEKEIVIRLDGKPRHVRIWFTDISESGQLLRHELEIQRT